MAVYQQPKEFESHKKQAKKSLLKLREKYKNILPGYECIISQELEKSEAPLKFLETEKTFLLWAFIPTEKLEAVENALKEITKNKIFYP